MEAQKIDLPAKVADTIIQAIRDYPEIEKVCVFGSRALGNAKPGSDIDLAVIGARVTPKTISKLRDFLEEETSIPYFFDVIAFNTIENEALRDHILRYGKVLYQSTDSVARP
ncbi:nucleotidyltransferase family protein [Desulfobulbus alkaliphilus]|uniref:nucleotidyltransferase family protein n=1 Tax=Desulfobulbus alkaliphilus TaxID=869814 RepID=UPI001964366C|nr:nucleotidyltransferase domain-containing protein [Desulfobulbus alkaliphilus]MBM9538578.1 nucleotidyltransferase domain-containing protein [Desulfobulbus alkaliphilus]